MKRLLSAMGMTSAFILVGLTISDPVIQSVWLGLGAAILIGLMVTGLIKFIQWAIEDL
jgi:hypothetical protein